MPDRIDYRFVTGWTDTGDFPCRAALRASLPGRVVDRPEGPFSLVYPGLDGQTVDFSHFCHRPTLIRRGLRCHVRAEAKGEARLRLETPGAVHLWSGARKIVAFEPYTRNQPKVCEICVPLLRGVNDLTLMLEDLHERDTNCFFVLTWLDGPEATAGIDVDEAAISEAAGLIERLRTEVFVESGPVTISADPPAAKQVVLAIRIAPFARGGIVADPEEALERQVTLKPECATVRLFDVSEVPAGCLSLDVSVTAGELRLSRRLGTTVFPEGRTLTGSLAGRKAAAADMIAKYQGFDPSVAVLLATRGEAPGRVMQVLDAAVAAIEQRYDCADFSLLPLLRLWRDAGCQLDPERGKRLKAAILGFRYWMTEPGNDVMWFWSENHALCFHVAELVAGQLFPDTVFPNSGRTGRKLVSTAETRLEKWFNSIEARGLGEWNSAAYYPIDLLALLTLYDMAPSWRRRAAALLDRIFEMVALHTCGGVPAGSQGRCYEKELLAGPATELGTIAAIAFGGTFFAGYDRAAALFCLSDYAPPEGISGLLAPAEPIEARYSQGADHAGRLTLWKSLDGQLSSVTGMEPGTEGHQTQFVDLQLAAHPMARIWINHPGEEKIWGERRPSLLAGSHVVPAIAQSGPLALLVFDLRKDWTRIRATQAFAAAGAFDGREEIEGWHVFRSGVGRGALWCSRELEPVTGQYAGSIWRAWGPQTAWAMTLALPAEDDPRFFDRLASARPDFDETRMILSCRDATGHFLELSASGNSTLDGSERVFEPLSPIPHIVRSGRHLRPENGWRG